MTDEPAPLYIAPADGSDGGTPYTQIPGHGSSPGKPAPPLATPTEVYSADGNRTGEIVRMKKRMVEGVEYLFAADGSGRIFQGRRQGLGAHELTPEEVADLNGYPARMNGGES